VKKQTNILEAMLLIFLFITACGKDAADSAPAVSLSDLLETMLAADTTLPELTKISSEDEQAELNFSYLSDLSYDLVDSYFYVYAKEGTAEEIAVIRLKDKNDAASMMQSLKEHVTLRKGTFEEYSPEQVGMAEKAVVTREGAYVALIISEKNGLVQKAFQSCFE